MRFSGYKFVVIFCISISSYRIISPKSLLEFYLAFEIVLHRTITLALFQCQKRINISGAGGGVTVKPTRAVLLVVLLTVNLGPHFLMSRCQISRLRF